MAQGYAGTLVFDVQQGAEHSAKRRRPEYSYDKWKYRVQTENDPASTLKRQRTNNVKKVKERERRTKMADAVQALRESIPGASVRKSNQIVVMNSAVDYIGKLEEAVRILQHESDLFRNALSQRGIPLPPGVSPNRFHLDFEVASFMDESDSDGEERRQDKDDFESASPTHVGAQQQLGQGSPQGPSSLPHTLITPYGSPPVSTSPSASTPIPIPGTVGAPIRPHESRTRLERITGSAQHLVNKVAPRERFQELKASPEMEHVDEPLALQPPRERDLGGDNGSSEDVIEGMDFMNEIEEVGEWPLHSHPSYASQHSLLPPPSKLSGHSPLAPSEASPYHSHGAALGLQQNHSGKSVGTFSPKLIFVDSPTNLLAGESYAAYTNPFDSTY